jgi:hypothetical protein
VGRECPDVGQDEDRALGIEKADDVVVVGDAAAPVRDVAQTSAAEREQFALGGLAVRKDICDPGEAIANWCAVVGCAGGKRLLQRGFWDESFGVQSLIPEKQNIERGEKPAIACRQQ